MGAQRIHVLRATGSASGRRDARVRAGDAACQLRALPSAEEHDRREDHDVLQEVDEPGGEETAGRPRRLGVPDHGLARRGIVAVSSAEAPSCRMLSCPATRARRAQGRAPVERRAAEVSRWRSTCARRNRRTSGRSSRLTRSPASTRAEPGSPGRRSRAAAASSRGTPAVTPEGLVRLIVGLRGIACAPAARPRTRRPRPRGIGWRQGRRRSAVGSSLVANRGGDRGEARRVRAEHQRGP